MADDEDVENKDVLTSDGVENLDSEIMSILSFEPENDEGNIEYKRSLLGKSKDRQLELETQMRYRMGEGDGLCTYIIGIEDDGTPYGLTDDEYIETRAVLEKIAKRNDYSLRLLVTSKCERGCVYEFLIRENNTINYEEIKIATGGNVDSSKTSTVGVLISGVLDDGRGSARLKVLNFKHEVESGRTSSISQQILGYDPEGNAVSHCDTIKKLSWPEIVARSSKIIKFFDLAGHAKYSRTTIRGLISSLVDYAIITVGSNMGVQSNTREHISICLTLHIPVIIFLTKIDLGEKSPDVMAETLADIKKIFSHPGSRKMLFSIDNINDVITASKNIKGGDIVPLFKTSNVRGDGLPLVHEFLNMIRPRLKFDANIAAM